MANDFDSMFPDKSIEPDGGGGEFDLMFPVKKVDTPASEWEEPPAVPVAQEQEPEKLGFFANRAKENEEARKGFAESQKKFQIKRAERFNRWMDSPNIAVSWPAHMVNFFTGSADVTPETAGQQPMSNLLAKQDIDMSRIKTGLGMLLTLDDQERAKIVKANYPDAKIRTLKDGQVLVNINGETAVLNPTGIDSSDVDAFAAQMLAFGGAVKFTNMFKPLWSRLIAGGASSAATQAGLEGAQVSLGGEFSPEEVKLAGVFGAGGELIAPVAGKIAAAGKKLLDKYRFGDQKIVDELGNPSERFKDILRREGTTFRQFLKENQIFDTATRKLDREVVEQLKTIPANTMPEEAARSALFKSIDVDPKRSSLSQQFDDVSSEQQLLAQRGGDDGAEYAQMMRNKYAQEAQDFQNSLTNFAERTGDTSVYQVGENIRDAVTGAKNLDRAARNEAYNTLAHLAEAEGASLRVLPDNILEAWKLERRTTGKQAAGVHAQLNDLMQEFSIRPPTQQFLDEAADEFASIEIKNLDLSNFEEFRKRLNAMSRTSEEARAVVKPIKDSLDNEMDAMLDGLESGSLGFDAASGIAQAAKKARSLHAKYKNEYGRSVVEKILAQNKQGDFKLDYHNIYKKLISTSAKTHTLKPLDDILYTLNKTPKGKAAIKDLQSVTTMGILNDASKNQAKMAGGVQPFSESGYKKALEGVGDAELKALFKNNQGGLNFLNRIKKGSRLAQVDKDAIPKGSAHQMHQAFSGVMGGLLSNASYGASLATDILMKVGNTQKKRNSLKAALQKGINSDPAAWTNYQELANNFTNLFRELNIVGLTPQAESMAEGITETIEENVNQWAN